MSRPNFGVSGGTKRNYNAEIGAAVTSNTFSQRRWITLFPDYRDNYLEEISSEA